MRVWVDMTASAHVLVFRPLIELLRRRGDEVEVTAREYAQTLQLLELHGIEAEVIGRHGGGGRPAGAAARRRAPPPPAAAGGGRGVPRPGRPPPPRPGAPPPPPR